MRKALIVLMICLAAGPSALGQTKLTYVDLVKRLTDMEALSVLPAAGERCAQWSSYDRASKYDSVADKYVGWDANGDGDGVIRMEGDTAVVAEIDGPGCIWRTWSAAPKAGHVKIYLDGAADPTVDLPFSGYFDCKNEPFTYPSLVHTTASGKNCYVPIPFQKSCRITADKGWGSYYHFTYTTYPKGTIVPTFKRQLAPEEADALKAADDYLTNRLGTDPAGARKGETTQTKTVTAVWKPVPVMTIKGARAITAIRVKPDPAMLVAPRASLRNAVLRIRWDGEKEPSVWVPVGDFFGAAPGVADYKSLPLGMDKGEFYCFWYMPFAKEATIELENGGEGTFTCEVSVTSAPLTRSIREMGRFHAKWHRDAFLPTEKERWIDWPMLKTNGRGRFCGVNLHIWNPKGGWWGEGDEKFFVDGEKFPSTIGTGSEDYFGYAWGSAALFQNAYHNQPLNDGGNAGHISVNRWHITDNVPFQKSIETDIEKYYGNKRPAWYAATLYWYLAPGGDDPYGPVEGADRWGFYTQDPPKSAEGAIEGESLKIISASRGRAEKQNVGDMGDWSGGAQVWWRRGVVGDKLTLALPVEKAGKYDVKAQFVKSWDYGVFRLWLDDQKVGRPVDLYSPSVTTSGEIDLGTLDLSAGEHKLIAEVIRTNDSAKPGVYGFGLDYVKLVAVP